MTNSLLLKMAIEIVDFPMKNGGSFLIATLNYQRVIHVIYPFINLIYDHICLLVK